MPSILEKHWAWVFPGAACALLLLLVWHHVQLVLTTVPLDYYEGTTVLITGLIAGMWVARNPSRKPKLS